MRAHRLSRTTLAAVLLTVWAGTAAAQSGRLRGTVRDEGGQPIKGATITAEFLDANLSSITVTTDDKGRFAMVGLRVGEWTFRVLAPGYQGRVTTFNARTADVNPSVTFALAKAFVAPSALGPLAPKDLQSALATADGLYNGGRWDEAIAAYRGILAQVPALTSINLQIAAAFRNKKDFDNAIGAYTALLKVEPNNDKAQVGIAMANLDKGDLEAAEKTLELASQAPDASRDVFFDLGEIRLARSRAADAARAYGRAAEMDPGWGKPELALGRLAATAGNPDAARKYFQTVIDVDPASPEAGQAATLLGQLGK